MMHKLMFAAAAASLLAGPAPAQDTPPPGCKWMGDGSLACKDGKGYWRRSGDDQIVGTYSVAKPKPKPKPAPVASSAPVSAAPVAAAPIASAPVVPPPAPLPPAPEPYPVAAASTEAELPPVPAELQAAAAAAAAPPAAVEPAPEAPKPWWRRWLDSLWRDIRAFLRLFGLGK